MGVFWHPAAFNATQMEGAHGGTGSEQSQQESRCGVNLIWEAVDSADPNRWFIRVIASKNRER